MGLREGSKLLKARHVFVSLHYPGDLRGHRGRSGALVMVTSGPGLKVLEEGPVCGRVLWLRTEAAGVACSVQRSPRLCLLLAF